MAGEPKTGAAYGASTLDPSIVNAALAKIASGKPLSELTPIENQAVGKLPPYVLQQTMDRRTAPPASGARPRETVPVTPPAKTPPIKTYGDNARQAQSDTAATMPNLPPLMGMQRAEQNALDTEARQFAEKGKFPNPAGNSAENQGLLPTGKYAGTAYYDGSTMRDPLNLADNIPPPPPELVTPSPATPTPPVNTANSGGPSIPWQRSNSGPYKGYDLGDNIPQEDVKKNSGYDVPVRSFPEIPKNVSKEKLANILSDIIDAMGGGMRAYAGVNSPTRLMKQGEIDMNVAAQKATAKNTSDQEYEQKIRMLAPELQAKVDAARAVGDINTEQMIAAQEGITKAILPLERQKAQNQADIEYNQLLRTMPEKVKAAAAEAQATGKWDAFYAVAKAEGLLPTELAKIREGARLQAVGVRNPAGYGLSLLGQ